jgi:hypothetical protein
VNQIGMQSRYHGVSRFGLRIDPLFQGSFIRFVCSPLDMLQLGKRGVVLIFPLLLHDKTNLTLLLKVAQLIAGAANLLLGLARGSA